MWNARRPVPVILFAFITLSLIPGPVSGEETSAIEAPKLEVVKNACCTGPGPRKCRDLERKDCTAESSDLSWVEADCTDIRCGACKQSQDTCVYTIKRRCDGPWSTSRTCQELLDAPIICVTESTYGGDNEVASNLDTFRAFRDTVLEPDNEGRELVEIYYDLSPEVAVVLHENPELRERGKALLVIAAEAVEQDDYVLTPETVRDVEAYLTDLQAEVSPEARASLERVKEQFREAEGLKMKEIRERLHK